MQKWRGLSGYMRDVSWSQHIQPDNKPSAKSVKSQSMLLKGNFDNFKWLAGEAHFAFLQQEEKRLSGNDVLALQLIWSQVQ